MMIQSRRQIKIETKFKINFIFDKIAHEYLNVLGHQKIFFNHEFFDSRT